MCGRVSTPDLPSLRGVLHRKDQTSPTCPAEHGAPCSLVVDVMTAPALQSLTTWAGGTHVAGAGSCFCAHAEHAKVCKMVKTSAETSEVRKDIHTSTCAASSAWLRQSSRRRSHRHATGAMPLSNTTPRGGLQSESVGAQSGRRGRRFHSCALRGSSGASPFFLELARANLYTFSAWGPPRSGHRTMRQSCPRWGGCDVMARTGCCTTTTTTTRAGRSYEGGWTKTCGLRGF